MQTISEIVRLRAAIRRLREGSDGPQKIALVPTMGALHEGHLALVRRGLALGAKVVTSIFVNPTQFAPGEDLARYPHREEADAKLLEELGCALVFLPTPAEIYPKNFATTVSVSGLDSVMEGASRPGHFNGVATVVTKLLNIVAPDYAIFGEKDWQQLAVIRRFVADLNLPVEIIGAPIVRAADGLALSSRNAYLSPDERRRATALPTALQQAARALRAGNDPAATLATARDALSAAGFGLDYLVLADGMSLEPLPAPNAQARLFVAATIGTTRLIDNVAV